MTPRFLSSSIQHLLLFCYKILVCRFVNVQSKFFFIVFRHACIYKSIVPLFPDDNASPSGMVLVGGSFGAGIIVCLIIVGIVLGIIYKRGSFNKRSKCWGFQCNDMSSIIWECTCISNIEGIVSCLSCGLAK